MSPLSQLLTASIRDVASKRAIEQRDALMAVCRALIAGAETERHTGPVVVEGFDWSRFCRVVEDLAPSACWRCHGDLTDIEAAEVAVGQESAAVCQTCRAELEEEAEEEVGLFVEEDEE
jgi:hypothetical protein